MSKSLPTKCPKCGSRNIQSAEYGSKKKRVVVYCADCDYEFEIRGGVKETDNPSHKYDQ